MGSIRNSDRSACIDGARRTNPPLRAATNSDEGAAARIIGDCRYIRLVSLAAAQGRMSKLQEIEVIFTTKRAYFVRVIARRLRDPAVAEEIVQEAFLQVASAAKIETIENPEGYVMRAAINLSTDWLRQEKSRRRREKHWADVTYAFAADGEAAATSPSPVQSAIAKDEFRRLEAAINLLTPQVRTAFTLHKIEGLSHQETAAKMGISRSTVEKHVMKAMRFLMDEMSKSGAIEARREPIRQVIERSADG